MVPVGCGGASLGGALVRRRDAEIMQRHLSSRQGPLGKHMSQLKVYCITWGYSNVKFKTSRSALCIVLNCVKSENTA